MLTGGFQVVFGFGESIFSPRKKCPNPVTYLLVHLTFMLTFYHFTEFKKSGGSKWNRRSRLGPPVSIPNNPSSSILLRENDNPSYFYPDLQSL
jgi:hypothetical protein